MFEVRHISFSYGRHPVLEDVSFSLSPGEIVAVAGANGAGKTTLLNVLATLAVPDAGAVLSEGRDAFAHPSDYRRQLGYLPERVALYEDMTVREYLFYRAALKGEPNRRVRRRVGEAVDRCRLGDVSGHVIGTLSAGQKKRVALADAILLRPRVLLLDDFLAGLDGALRESAGGLLADVASFSSLVVTGHETDDLARWATRFVVLRDGRVAATVESAGVDRASVRAAVDAAVRGGAA